MSAPAEDSADRKQYMYQFLELLGLGRERIVFIEEPVSESHHGFALRWIHLATKAIAKSKDGLVSICRTELVFPSFFN